jgi:ABC-type Mn2+/Zn2+ transport system ATPase subunit
VFHGTQLAVVASMARSAEAGDNRRPAERLAADLTPGPGLTLIVGRNGSGKSSLQAAVVPSVVPGLAPGD